MNAPPSLFDNLLTKLKAAQGHVSDPGIALEADQKLSPNISAWRNFSMFWPPRIVKALGACQVVPFLGAGVSLAAGIPTWIDMLRNHLKLHSAYTDDKELEHDPLTLAEIASQRNGTSKVQDTLRDLTSRAKTPTASHILFAALRCPIYITTNYDTLLEDAWTFSNGGKMQVIVNDADLIRLGYDWSKHDNLNSPLLFKIHGSLARFDEQLILTRHDYRHHYRANQKFFDAVRSILQSRHVLFAGFSHRDPEVTRLVDDAIYAFEQSSKPPATTSSAKTPLVNRSPAAKPQRPHFYSLQFDMLEHSPEIFAAKGLVALKPPFFPAAPSLGKSLSLCIAIGELAHAQQLGLHSQASIDDDLHKLAATLEKHTEKAIGRLKSHTPQLLADMKAGKRPKLRASIVGEIGQLASQGVYLLDRDGVVLDCVGPKGLKCKERKSASPTLSDRPYFRIAKSFRDPFISDNFPSTFNGNATIAICFPILDGLEFFGLLFAATHVGTWDWLSTSVKEQWQKKRSVILVDSNGIALFPPNNERPLRDLAEIKAGLKVPSEEAFANVGHSYDDLFALSRRDALIRHLVENIVPISQDDDVFELGGDLEYYSVVTEVPQWSRWKLGISEAFDKSKH